VPESTVIRYIDKRQLLERVPYSYVTIWKRMKAGTFPAPRVLGGKNVWSEEEVNAYLASLAKRDCYPGGAKKSRERPIIHERKSVRSQARGRS
jgi:predicted DNA-binding transcriptional regulator AlpA